MSARTLFSWTVAVAELTALGAGVLAGSVLGAGWIALCIAAAIVVRTTMTGGLDWRFHPSALDDFPTILRSTAGATLLVAVVPLLVHGSADPFGYVDDAVLTGAVLLVLATTGRFAAYATVRRQRRHRCGLARALVIGTGRTGRRIGDALTTDPTGGVELVGFVDDEFDEAPSVVPIGSLADLPDLIVRERIDVIVVAYWRGSCAAAVDPMRLLHGQRCEVYVLPRFHELHDRAGDSEIVADLPLDRLRRPAFRRLSWRVKRALDILLASVGLVLVAPVLGIVALAVRLESGPGVIFRQERIGLRGRPFTLYKFRSLTPVGDEGEVRWNIDQDARLRPVGKFIRTSALDELPQLVNILRGDMSLVGPRPERPHFVEEFSRTVPGYPHRHRMPVGLTGLAVVRGLHGDTSIPDRAHYDNLYAESWSLWLDVKIVLRTAGQVLGKMRTRSRSGRPGPPS
ncbi:sugar transferase [Pseudonocardia acidicola]|uniref:sugar transferase n=1 Tax=Pseudonocardia acidicola TaxID=2724939 RepID=UPI001B7D1019